MIVYNPKIHSESLSAGAVEFKCEICFILTEEELKEIGSPPLKGRELFIEDLVGIKELQQFVKNKLNANQPTK